MDRGLDVWMDEQQETRGKQAGGRAHHSPIGKHAHPRWRLSDSEQRMEVFNRQDQSLHMATLFNVCDAPSSPPDK